MIDLLENGVMSTDLDAKGFNIVNLGGLEPPPSNMASADDPRLSDPRVPLDGSVSNASIAAGAAIDQSKLNLDGNIPPSWIGASPTQAAAGNLAEYTANKGMPNGYAPLDGTGKVPVAYLPAEVGTGTITSIGLTMPPQFNVTGSPVTGAGTLGVAWNNNAPNLSWFGNLSGAPAAPQFYTIALPAVLIPSLSAGKVTSGVFVPSLIPLALYGAGHQPGGVPDPGDGIGGSPNDYLARNMTYMPVPSLGPFYQPAIPTLTLAFSGSGTNRQVIPSSTVAGVTFFYATAAITGPYQEVPSVGYFPLPTGQAWVYAARPGYGNSPIATIGP